MSAWQRHAARHATPTTTGGSSGLNDAYARCVCVCVCVSVQESWLGLTRSVYRGASNAVHVDALTKELQVLDPDLQVRLFLSSNVHRHHSGAQPPHGYGVA